MLQKTFILLVLVYTTCPGWADTLSVPAEYPTIQAAIDAATIEDTVLVAPGVYKGTGNRDIDFQGKLITVRSDNGPDYTVIDCEGSESSQHRGFNFHTGESDDAVLEGFTIRNGYSSDGGGVYCYQSSPKIVNCRIFNNTVVNSGGGITCWLSNAKVMDCEFDNNTAESGGGVYVAVNSNALIVNCVIHDSSAYWGGGISCNGSVSPRFYRCLLYSNHASAGGAVYSANGASPYFYSCTISGNTANFGAGLHMYNGPPTVRDSILWGNSPYEIDVQSGADPVITYTNVYQDSGVWSGTGNINTDPLFDNPSLYQFQLAHTATGHTATSPCVNTGSMSASAVCFEGADGDICLNELSTRTDGMPDMGIADMGYHYEASPPGTPTPTPAPTPDCTVTGTTLWMPDTEFSPGETCACQVTVCNASGSPLINHPLFVLLDVYGSYYFAPSFTAFDSYLSMYPQFNPGPTQVEVLPVFNWPAGAGSASGLRFYSALTDPGISQLVGQMDQWEFGWTE